MTTDDLITIQPPGAVKDLLSAQQARIADLETSRDNYARLAADWEGVANRQRGEIDVLEQLANRQRREHGQTFSYYCDYTAALERQCDLRYSAGRKLAHAAALFWQRYQDTLAECDALRRDKAVLVNELTRRGVAWHVCAVAAGWGEEVGT